MKKSIANNRAIHRLFAILASVCFGLALIAISFVNAYANGTPVFLVKTGDTIGGKTLELVSGFETFSNLSFNNFGELVFLGWWDADNDGFPERRGIFTQDALVFEPPGQLGGHNVGQISFPSINDSGDIAFLGIWDDNEDGFADGQGIFSLENGLLFEDGGIVGGKTVNGLSSFDQPVINSSGEVAFMGKTGTETWSPYAVVTQDRILVQEGDIIDGTEIRSLSFPYKYREYNFNSKGELAFLATLPGEFPAPYGVFTTEKLIFKEDEVFNDGKILRRLGVPVINDDGEIAVWGDFNQFLGDSAVLTPNGVLIEDGAVIDGRVLDQIRSVDSINNLGEVLFMADYLVGGEKYRGWFTQDRFMIDVPAVVEGITIYLLGNSVINDNGDAVFSGLWYLDGAEASGIVLVTKNGPPVCDANGPYEIECTGPTTDVPLDGSGSYDPDGDAIDYTWSNIFPGGTASGPTPTLEFSGYGSFYVDLEVVDDYGSFDTCSADVDIVDTTPPEIDCSASITISPPDVPISFMATATDVCTGSVTAEITEYDCFDYTKRGRRIDKTRSCVVTFSGETITILDSGGVGDNISWTVSATDASGNTNTKECEVEVVNPVQSP